MSNLTLCVKDKRSLRGHGSIAVTAKNHLTLFDRFPMGYAVKDPQYFFLILFLWKDGECAERQSWGSIGCEHLEGVVRSVHQHRQCHLRQLHCERRKHETRTRRVGLNVFFIYQVPLLPTRDYTLSEKDIEFTKLETGEDKGLKGFRWKGMIF